MPIYINIDMFFIKLSQSQFFVNNLRKHPNFPINNELEILSKINKTKAEMMEAENGKL